LRTFTVRGLVRPVRAGVVIELTADDARSGRRVVTLSETAETQRLVPAAAGRLAVALRRALGDDPVDDADAKPVGCSESIDAIHELTAAGAQLHEGKYEEAAAHARLAIKADPGFAEAHMTLGVLLFDLERRADGQRELKEAADHVEGVSDHRRLLILGLDHAVMEDFDKAAPEFAELVARWPFDDGQVMNLAEMYMGMGDVDRALTTIRTAVRETPTVLEREDLARFELAAGHFEVAATEARRIQADFPSHPPDLAGWLAIAEALQGHRDAALEAYRDLERADAHGAVIAEADFAMFEGRFDDAAALLGGRLATELKSHSEATAKAWALLAELRSLQGDKAGALEAAQHVPMSSDTSTLFRAASVLARIGAQKLAADAATSLLAHPGLHARIFSTLLSGDELRAEGRVREAVRAIESGHPGELWLTHASLAQAELDAGAFEDAERELELCQSRMGEGADALLDTTPTIRYLPGIRYALARVREGLGRADAKKAYEEFLAMEPNAQHDPRVLDAKKRLSQLH
jgi:tetratricopeptide (TPR) repeat protein